MTRRRFLMAAGGTVCAGAATAGYAGWVEPHWVRVTRRDLRLPGVPPRWHGRTLAFISDLHVGPRVDADYLRRWLAWVVERSPDAVLIGGDFMTCRQTERVAETVDVIRTLTPASVPVFASLGNHDYGYRWMGSGTADELHAALSQAGVTVLRDECVDHDGLPITGLDDLWSPRFSPARCADALGMAGGGVALAHNPDTADLPIWSGFHGTILSGHTHGGQVRVPVYGPVFVPVRNKRYIAGSYALDDRRDLYVSRGLGHSHRVRLFTRPEVTMFRVTTA